MSAKVMRRDFLKVVAVTGAVTPFAMTGTAHGAAAPQALVGRVRSASAGRLRVVTGKTSVTVLAGAGARLYSGAFGEVQDTSAFVPGDRVVVEGTRRGDVIEATAVGSVFTPLTVRVRSVSKDGSVAETSAGPVELTKGRLPFTTAAYGRRARVASGQVLKGMSWADPATGQRYLMVSAG